MIDVKTLVNKINFLDKDFLNMTDYVTGRLEDIFLMKNTPGIVSIIGKNIREVKQYTYRMILKLLMTNECCLMYLTNQDKPKNIMRELVATDLNINPRIRFNYMENTTLKVKLLKTQKTFENARLYFDEYYDEESKARVERDILFTLNILSSGKKYQILIYDNYDCDTDLLEKLNNKLNQHNTTMIIVLASSNSIETKESIKQLETISNIVVKLTK